MTAEAPNAQSLNSWEDAFQYTIPVVHQLEQQLRRDISSNRERLRTLVGANYRDLLGTAESIIDMDGQMQQVEAYLGDMGKKCNTKLLEKSVLNLGLLEEKNGYQDRNKFAFSSQLAMLRSCPQIIFRLLRKDESTLLAAKVLVISRLLYKKLSETSQASAYVEHLRLKLAKLRRKLLSVIDRCFGTSSSSKELIDAMCAFTLATSSSVTDVLRHFHHVRSETISKLLGTEDGSESNVLRALQLWIRTSRDTLAIFPRSLATSLTKMRSVSLLKSDDVQSIIELDLDIHIQWIGDEIRNFTPYIRHDDIRAETSTQLLTIWAPEAFEMFLQGVSRLLRSINDPATIVQLRTECLKLWFANRSHIVGVDRTVVLNKIREAFNSKLLDLMSDRCMRLQNMAGIIDELIQEDRTGISSSLWDASTIAMDTSNGGKKFSRMLQDRSYGRSGAVHAVLNVYQQWLRSIEGVNSVIEDMKNARWNEIMEDLDDDGEVVETEQTLLSYDDPQSLREALHNTCTNAYHTLEESIAQQVSTLQNDDRSGETAIFLLRITREMRNVAPLDHGAEAFGVEYVKELHGVITRLVVKRLISQHRGFFIKEFSRPKVSGRLLWDGTPEIPVLPSPWCFNLLQALQQSLTNIGADVWSSMATQQLKPMLRNTISEELPAPVELVRRANGSLDEEISDKLSNVPTEDNRDSTGAIEREMSERLSILNNDCNIQRLFDLAYLRSALSTHNEIIGGDHLESRFNTLAKHVHLAPSLVSRLDDAASEYWKRTSLLFALLT